MTNKVEEKHLIEHIKNFTKEELYDLHYVIIRDSHVLLDFNIYYIKIGKFAGEPFIKFTDMSFFYNSNMLIDIKEKMLKYDSSVKNFYSKEV